MRTPLRPKLKAMAMATEDTDNQVTDMVMDTEAMEATVHTAAQPITATSHTVNQSMDTHLAMVELVMVTLAPLAMKVMVHTMPILHGATLKMLPELAGGALISSTLHLRSLTRLINRSTAQSSPNVQSLRQSTQAVSQLKLSSPNFLTSLLLSELLLLPDSQLVTTTHSKSENGEL